MQQGVISISYPYSYHIFTDVLWMHLSQEPTPGGRIASDDEMKPPRKWSFQDLTIKPTREPIATDPAPVPGERREEASEVPPLGLGPERRRASLPAGGSERREPEEKPGGEPKGILKKESKYANWDETQQSRVRRFPSPTRAGSQHSQSPTRSMSPPRRTSSRSMSPQRTDTYRGISTRERPGAETPISPFQKEDSEPTTPNSPPSPANFKVWLCTCAVVSPPPPPPVSQKRLDPKYNTMCSNEAPFPKFVGQAQVKSVCDGRSLLRAFAPCQPQKHVMHTYSVQCMYTVTLSMCNVPMLVYSTSTLVVLVSGVPVLLVWVLCRLQGYGVQRVQCGVRRWRCASSMVCWGLRYTG